jgi:hypothetical protein
MSVLSSFDFYKLSVINTVKLMCLKSGINFVVSFLETHPNIIFSSLSYALRYIVGKTDWSYPALIVSLNALAFMPRLQALSKNQQLRFGIVALFMRNILSTFWAHFGARFSSLQNLAKLHSLGLTQLE